MEWNKNESKQATFYIAESEISSRADAMAELWQAFADEVLPQNDDVGWDYVRAEFGPDSGRIIVFPASSGVSKRIEKAGCQVIFSELLSAYDQLADANIDDDESSEQLTALQAEWANDLEKAARASKLSNLRICFLHSGSEEPFREVALP